MPRVASSFDPWNDGLHALGAPFMTSSQLASEARSLGLPEHTLYFRGRVGPLGELTAASAAQALGVFPYALVKAVWSRTSAVSATDATLGYLRACHAWGREHLPDEADTERLAALLGDLCGVATTDYLPVAAAWTRVDLPADAPARLAQAAMAVREIRGGLHFAALALVNLPIRRALAINEENHPGRLARTGWREDAIRELVGESRPGDRERWQEAEDATGTGLRRVLSEGLGAARTDEAGVLIDRLAASQR